jgi:hydroxypyruvate isomerase
MIAIHTKCLSATNTRGARIKAYTRSGFSITISYPYKYSYELAHFEAVKELVKKHNLNWDLTNMRYGDSADGRGYVFCFECSAIN